MHGIARLIANPTKALTKRIFIVSSGRGRFVVQFRITIGQNSVLREVRGHGGGIVLVKCISVRLNASDKPLA
jgi:hypothetical protein